MTTFYSPHFTDETPSTTVLGVTAKPRVKAPSGTKRARMYYTSARIDLSAATIAQDDLVRMFSLKSGDRIVELFVSNDAAWAATALQIDIGLYKSGNDHDGAIILGDCFVDGLAFSGTLARTNAFFQATDILPDSAGMELWELVNVVSASTYATDPQEDWDLVVKFSSVNTLTASGVINLECQYVSQLGA